MKLVDELPSNGGFKNRSERLPYEIPVPKELWGMLDGSHELDSNAAITVVVIPGGDLIVRGDINLNVPKGNPFAVAFYRYLKSNRDEFASELQPLLGSDLVEKYIKDASQAAAEALIWSPVAGSHRVRGGGAH